MEELLLGSVEGESPGTLARSLLRPHLSNVGGSRPSGGQGLPYEGYAVA